MGLIKKKSGKKAKGDAPAGPESKPRSPLEIVEPFSSSPAFTTRKKEAVFVREGSVSSTRSNPAAQQSSDPPRATQTLPRSATVATTDANTLSRMGVEPVRTGSIGTSSSSGSNTGSLRALPAEFPAPSSTTLQMTLEELIKTARICKIPKTKRGYGFHVKGLSEKKKEFTPSVEAPCSQFMFGVDKDSESHKAGVMANDFIHQINGKDVSVASHREVVELIKKSGDPLILSLIQVVNREQIYANVQVKPQQTKPAPVKMRRRSSLLSAASSINLLGRNKTTQQDMRRNKTIEYGANRQRRPAGQTTGRRPSDMYKTQSAVQLPTYSDNNHKIAAAYQGTYLPSEISDLSKLSPDKAPTEDMELPNKSGRVTFNSRLQKQTIQEEDQAHIRSLTLTNADLNQLLRMQSASNESLDRASFRSLRSADGENWGSSYSLRMDVETITMSTQTNHPSAHKKLASGGHDDLNNSSDSTTTIESVPTPTNPPATPELKRADPIYTKPKKFGYKQYPSSSRPKSPGSSRAQPVRPAPGIPSTRSSSQQTAPAMVKPVNRTTSAPIPRMQPGIPKTQSAVQLSRRLSQPVIRTQTRLINQPTNRPTSQLVEQPIRQPVRQPVSQVMFQPTIEPSRSSSPLSSTPSATTLNNMNVMPPPPPRRHSSLTLKFRPKGTLRNKDINLVTTPSPTKNNDRNPFSSPSPPPANNTVLVNNPFDSPSPTGLSSTENLDTNPFSTPSPTENTDIFAESPMIDPSPRKPNCVRSPPMSPVFGRTQARPVFEYHTPQNVATTTAKSETFVKPVIVLPNHNLREEELGPSIEETKPPVSIALKDSTAREIKSPSPVSPRSPTIALKDSTAREMKAPSPVSPRSPTDVFKFNTEVLRAAHGFGKVSKRVMRVKNISEESNDPRDLRRDTVFALSSGMVRIPAKDIVFPEIGESSEKRDSLDKSEKTKSEKTKSDSDKLSEAGKGKSTKEVDSKKSDTAKKSGSVKKSDKSKKSDSLKKSDSSKKSNSSKKSDSGKKSDNNKSDAAKTLNNIKESDNIKKPDTSKKVDDTKKSDTTKKSENTKKSDTAKKSESTKTSDTAKISDSAKNVDTAKKSDITKDSDSPKKSDTSKKTDITKDSDSPKKSDTAKKSDITKDSASTKKSDTAKKSNSTKDSDKKSDTTKRSNSTKDSDKKSDTTKKSDTIKEGDSSHHKSKKKSEKKWLCEGCDTDNSGDFCSKCHMPKRQLWHCPACEVDNSRSKCSGCKKKKEEVVMIPVLPNASAAEINEQRARLTSTSTADNNSLQSTQSEPVKPVSVSRSPDNRPVLDEATLPPKSKSAEDIARKAAEMRQKRGALKPGEKAFNYDLPPPPTAIPPPPPPDDLPPPPPAEVRAPSPPPPPSVTEAIRVPSPPPPPSETHLDREDNESYDSGFIQNGKHVEDWESVDVADWLSGLGLGEYKDIFVENDIRGPNLLELSKNDLKELGVTKLGHRITLMKEIKSRLSEGR